MTVRSRTVMRSALKLSTPRSSVPASRAASTRASMRPRYSSKMAFWSTEVDELRDQTRVETIYLVTGLLLPVWGKLPGDHVQVWRLTTEEDRKSTRLNSSH